MVPFVQLGDAKACELWAQPQKGYAYLVGRLAPLNGLFQACLQGAGRHQSAALAVIDDLLKRGEGQASLPRVSEDDDG